MRIFVLTTGRAASTTFAQACVHLEGMTASHESRSQLIEGRLDYPDNHVEVDNRLAWFLGSLDRLYDDADTFYVWLRRDRAAVSQSYSKRWFVRQSLVRAFHHGILMRKGVPTAPERLDSCDLCMRTIEDNIEFFLKGRSNSCVVTVENLQEDFQRFVQRVGLPCDLERALAALTVVTNLNKGAGRAGSNGRARRLWRAVKRLPEYFREQ